MENGNRKFDSNPKKKYEKEMNLDTIKEKESLEKNNDISQFKYFIMLDAHHCIWNSQEYSNMIIDQIKCKSVKIHSFAA